MAVSTNTESTELMQSSNLGKCEVCNNENPKYTCPRCEVKSCSLKCVQIHKVELSCNGERDKLAYKPLSQFTNIDLLSDYRLMEHISRSVDSYQRDPSKKYSRIKRDLPHHLYQLRTAATKRGCRLNFLPQNFSRHKSNTTFFDWKKNILYWRVDWVFPQADNLILHTERFLETQKLSSVLYKYLHPESESNPALQFYQAAGISGVKLLLKAEGIKKSNSRFYILDPSLSIKANLKGKFIVEYPTIWVILKDHNFIYDIIDSDDEIEDVKDVYFPGNISGVMSEQKPRSEAKNFLFNGELSNSCSDEDETIKAPKQKKLDIPEYDVLVKQSTK